MCEEATGVVRAAGPPAMVRILMFMPRAAGFELSSCLAPHP